MKIKDEKVKKKWMIWGSEGFVGKHFSDILLRDNQVIGVFRGRNSEFCVRDSNASEKTFNPNLYGIRYILEHFEPNFLVNCAGMASIENCAERPGEADLSNSLLPKLLAEACIQVGTKFIHISTDAVFGQPGILFNESETPMPNSVYSKTKLQGEKLAIEMNPNSLIIRTRPLGVSAKKTTLVDYFLSNFLQGNPIPGHKNVFFTPIFISDLAQAIEKLANSSESGIWNLVAGDRISKFDVGIFLLERLGLPSNYLYPVDFSNADEKSKRSLDTSLSNAKYSDKFGGIPSVFEGLEPTIIREWNINIERWRK